ncbi:MAG: phosphonoacetaldehyde hydrolase [Desulfosarcinaceae bacterium]
MTPYACKTPYMGPLQAAVLDWAGTAVDFGCQGPAAVFTDVFEKHGIQVTVTEARQFMGLSKRDHVAAICALPAVVDQWRRRWGQIPGAEEIDRIYADLEPAMIDTVVHHADPIPGVLEAVANFRALGLKIGSCTGYTRSMIEALAPVAREKGYAPDAVVCASDVPAGRPAPFMCYLNAVALRVYPMEAMVKIGDTVADIEEGLNAGMWTIGLTLCGNEIGLSPREIAALPIEELGLREGRVARRFRAAGVHYIAQNLRDCPPLIEAINRRMASGGRPLGGR